MHTHVEPVQVTVDGLTLRGTLTTPSGDRPSAVVVLHHGFGGQRTEAARSFVQLTRALVDRGIATAAFDRAGHGESDGAFADTTVSRDVAHMIAALESIVGHPRVDAADVHLMGTSLGAVVASVVAAECGRPIRSLTMWSPAALFVDEITGGHLQGVPIDVLTDDGFFDFRGMRLATTFFDDARDFDVYGRAAGYDGPVRVLHGDRDFIPASYAEAYADVYGDAVQYTLVAGADHCWESVPARDTVIGATTEFIASHVRTPSSDPRFDEG